MANGRDRCLNGWMDGWMDFCSKKAAKPSGQLMFDVSMGFCWWDVVICLHSALSPATRNRQKHHNTSLIWEGFFALPSSNKWSPVRQTFTLNFIQVFFSQSFLSLCLSLSPTLTHLNCALFLPIFYAEKDFNLLVQLSSFFHFIFTTPGSRRNHSSSD